MNHLIVAGSRGFADQEIFDTAMSEWFANNDPDRSQTTIVCGMARGGDMMGYHFAKKHGMPILEMPAQWDRYGRKLAGRVRNQEMADAATHLIAFWDCASHGTRDMIDRAKLKGLNVEVIHYRRVEGKITKTLW